MGGNGAAGDLPDGSVGVTAANGGGGGGAVGRIRINTHNHNGLQGVMSPTEASGGLSLGGLRLAP